MTLQKVNAEISGVKQALESITFQKKNILINFN